MKTLITTCVICLVVCLVSCKEEKKKSIVDNNGKDQMKKTKNSKSSLSNALAIFTQSLIEPTQEVLDGITDDQLSYGHSSGVIQNKSEFIHDVLHGSFDFLTIELSNQEITYTNDLAIVRHVFDSKALSNGQEVHVIIGVMLVWVYNSDRWKLVARQAYGLNN